MYQSIAVHFIEDKANTMVRTLLAEYDLPEDTSENFTAKCRHCASHISGSIKVQSKFTTHLQIYYVFFILYMGLCFPLK